MTAISWIVFVLIGIVLGLWAEKILGGKRVRSMDITVGLAGSILGGWSAMAAIGVGTMQGFIIAVLCSGLGAAILLWIVGWLLLHFSK